MNVGRSIGFALGLGTACSLAAAGAAASSHPVRHAVAGALRATVDLHRFVRSSPRSGARGPSWMTHVDTHKRLVYLSNFLGGEVAVFDAHGSLVGAINGLTNPSGMFVDTSENLWVTNTYAYNVLVYPRGATAPSMKLADPGELPVDVSVCPNGTVYVSNLENSSQSGSGNVAVYAPGATSPTGTLSYPNQASNYFVTCDANNNVFTTLFIGSAGAVVEYPHGEQKGAVNLGVTLEFPGGIKPDPAGNLVVNDQEARTLTEYTEAGTPTGVQVAYGGSNNDWVDISLNAGGKIVAGADAYLGQGTALHFPSGKPGIVYYPPAGPSGDEPDGIAYDPGQPGI